MAPMRSHIFDQFRRLKTSRKVSFWYGARSLREAFYLDDFDSIAAEHDNFEWHLALSEPLPEDNWTGHTGFIHQVVLDEYALKDGRASHALSHAHSSESNVFGNGSGDAAALEEEATKMTDTVVQVLRCLVQSDDEYLARNMNWLMGSLCELVRCRDEKVRLALHKVMVQKVSTALRT